MEHYTKSRFSSEPKPGFTHGSDANEGATSLEQKALISARTNLIYEATKVVIEKVTLVTGNSQYGSGMRIQSSQRAWDAICDYYNELDKEGLIK